MWSTSCISATSGTIMNISTGGFKSYFSCYSGREVHRYSLHIKNESESVFFRANGATGEASIFPHNRGQTSTIYLFTLFHTTATTRSAMNSFLFLKETISGKYDVAFVISNGIYFINTVWHFQCYKAILSACRYLMCLYYYIILWRWRRK